MADFDYWQKQGKRALFGEVDCLRPDQKRLAGKFLVIGGNTGAVFTVSTVMREATSLGAGECRAVLPESLRTVVPVTPELLFAPAEASGGFGKSALPLLLEQVDWADMVLLVGDFGKNDETMAVIGQLLAEMDERKPVYVMRDGVDAVVSRAQDWAMRTGDTVLLATVPQLQKLLRALYYPKIITLTMPMNQLVEVLHKVTLSYGLTIMTIHDGQLVVAQDGEVVSMAMQDTDYTMLTLFGGGLFAKMAVLGQWNEGVKKLRSVATAWGWQ